MLLWCWLPLEGGILGYVIFHEFTLLVSGKVWIHLSYRPRLIFTISLFTFTLRLHLIVRHLTPHLWTNNCEWYVASRFDRNLLTRDNPQNLWPVCHFVNSHRISSHLILSFCPRINRSCSTSLRLGFWSVRSRATGSILARAGARRFSHLDRGDQFTIWLQSWSCEHHALTNSWLEWLSFHSAESNGTALPFTSPFIGPCLRTRTSLAQVRALGHHWPRYVHMDIIGLGTCTWTSLA